MESQQKNRLVETFEELRKQNKQTLMPFLTAGYPDLETTGELLDDFERRGVRICELGVPYSDPIADGPVIQASYTECLADGVNSSRIFDMVRRYRKRGGSMALLAMVSYSIVYRHGVESYLQKAADAGFDGTIIPDLPLSEAEQVAELSEKYGICNVLLIAPTTSQERRAEIAEHSSGFIYYISVAGTTGERNELPEHTIRGVQELRERTDTPICVGFGISKPEMVSTVCNVADGAIVGSAIVHRITEQKDQPREELIEHVGEFVASLLAPVK